MRSHREKGGSSQSPSLGQSWWWDREPCNNGAEGSHEKLMEIENKICLLCVERSTKYCNYLRLSPTMFFLCTFYGRGSVSKHQHEGGIFRLECTQHHLFAALYSTSRHVLKTRKFCATELLLCSSLHSPLIHIWLWPPFFGMDNTYAHEICCWSGVGSCEALAVGGKRNAKRERVELKNR